MATPTVDTSEIRRKGRQRLIGAITIVLLLVVFVPMLLDPEPRTDKKDPVVAIPSKDNAPPLPTPSKAEPAKTPAPVETATPPKAEVPKPEAAKAEAPAAPTATVAPKASLTDASKASAPPKAPATPPAAAAPAKEAPKAAAAPKLEGFAIQVGAFGDEAKLTQAREKLAGARIPHFTERLPNGLTRLRAGPYKTREEADKATGALKAAGLDGKVVPLP